MFKSFVLSLAAVAVASPALFAQGAKEAAAPTLKVGMPAPALAIDKWVKGSPVASLEKGKTYVVEFWATWCGPCVKSMPHMTELQHQYKDQVSFISVTTKDESNTLDAVEKMVAQKGDLMGYTVAFDKNEETKKAWRDAAATQGIPVSFVVDKSGQVVYIGHPMYLDFVLKGVTAGTWNMAEGAKQVEELDAKFDALFKTIKSDPKAAMAQANEFVKVAPGGMAFVGVPLFNSLLKINDYDGAYTMAKQLVDTAIAHKDAMELNMIAWTIADPEAKIEKRDVDLALRAALKADEFTESKSAEIIDTVARCYAWKGDFKKAVELETKAVGLANDKMKPDLQKALDEFKAKNTQ